MKSIKKLILSTGAIALLSNPAYAMDNSFRLQDNTAEDDTGFYLGVGVSRVSTDAAQEFDDFDLDFSDTANTLNFRAGYMFSNWFGVEAAYYDFGDLEDTIQDLIAEFTDDQISSNLDLKGYGLSLVGTLPLKYVDLYLKGGAVRLDGEISASANGISASRSEDSTEPFAAVGAEVDFGMINFFGEYSRIIDNDDIEVDFISAGVKFEF